MMYPFPEHDMDIALTAYMDYVIADYNKDSYAGHQRNSSNMTIQPGSKFYKIVNVENGVNYNHMSVHSFVVRKAHGKFKAGDILKAASWHAPAKNFSRGNILTGELKRVRWTGVS